jgi:hypothetical protein
MPDETPDPVRPPPPEPVQSSHPAPADDDEDEGSGSSNKPLYALAFLVVLAIGGWLLISRLMDASKMQDCIMAGRHNCAPVDTAGR